MSCLSVVGSFSSQNNARDQHKKVMIHEREIFLLIRSRQINKKFKICTEIEKVEPRKT